jgi:hypothetical protein
MNHDMDTPNETPISIRSQSVKMALRKAEQALLEAHDAMDKALKAIETAVAALNGRK